MKKYYFAIAFFLILNNIKSQNCFNLDSILNHLEAYEISSIDRQKETHNFYENLIGCKAPQFTAKSFNGDVINFDSLLGKVVVINFWFIDCAPCIAELPMLNDLVNSYKNNTNIKFLAMSRDDSNYISKAFIGKHKFDFEIIPDAEFIVRKFCVLGYPKTYILDKEGKVRKIIPFGLSSYQNNETLIEMKKIINECLEE